MSGPNALREDGGPGDLPQRPVREMARHRGWESRSQRAEALRDGRGDDARQVRRDAGLHGIPAGALAPDQDEQRGIERINREIRRRTSVVGKFPDGNSALMLVTARLKYIVEYERGKRRYLDMSKLEEMDELKGKAGGARRGRLNQFAKDS